MFSIMIWSRSLSKYRPLIFTAIVLSILDAIAIAAMLVAPELTSRVIPALVAIQIIGFVVIVGFLANRRPWQNRDKESQDQLSKQQSTWAIWLLCGVALLFLFRALLAIIYMLLHGWHSRKLLVPIAGFGVSGYLFYLAYRVAQSIRAKDLHEIPERGSSKRD